MAGGHVGTYGAADGVTQPGGTPGSTVRGRPARDPGDRDLIGTAGAPVRHSDVGDVGDLAHGVPVDEAERAARAVEPGQQVAAGEG